MYVVGSDITGGTICYGHRRVYFLRSHITGCAICYGHRYVEYELMRASTSVCFEITLIGRYDLLPASTYLCCEGTYHKGYDESRIVSALRFTGRGEDTRSMFQVFSLATWVPIEGPIYKYFTQNFYVFQVPEQKT